MINVMIVDDQQPTRMGFSLMVMKDPALRMTLQAGNGQDALDILRHCNYMGRASLTSFLWMFACLLWMGSMPRQESNSYILQYVS